jgi:hypothetical protein
MPPGQECAMGIWLELGIFIVVLVWAIWQWRDARQALERTRAAKAREAAQAQASEGHDAPSRKTL